MECKICGEFYGRQGGHFNKHLKDKHNINSYVDYVIKVDYNGIRPKCKCGCGEYTTFHNNKFKEYVHGHNSEHQYEKIHQDRPNDEIIELYKQGKNGDEITEILKLPRGYVYRIIKKEGVTRTMSEAKRIYSIDENVFDNIDNEEKSYWLGFLFADGYNHEERGTITLTLQNLDMDILEKFRQFLKTDKPIGRNNDMSSKVVIESKHMSKTLSKLGVIQNKTHFLSFPTIKKDLIKHFIRGYFDGDGCVSYGKELNTHCNISLVSTKSFLSVIEEIVPVKFYWGKRHKGKDDEIYTLSSGGVTNIIKFYHYLYHNSYNYMDRKKDKFLKWFSWYFNNHRMHNKTKKLKEELLWGIKFT